MPASDSPRKVFAVTGGASGIGAAAVALLASRGHAVVVMDVQPPARTPAGDVRFIRTDVADEASVRSAFADIDAAGGGLAALVNSAGVESKFLLASMTLQAWERVQRINHTLSMIPPQARDDCPLKPIELLVIAPSSRLDEIAARHLRALPAPVLAMLGALGVTEGSDLLQGHAQAALKLHGRDGDQAHATLAQRSQAPELPTVRRVLGRLGRSHIAVAIDLWRCDSAAHAQAWSAAAQRVVQGA